MVKTPQRLGNCMVPKIQTVQGLNNKKQKKLSALFGCILETVFCEFRLILLDHITYFDMFIFKQILFFSL